MNCNQTQAALDSYLDGDLAAKDKQAIDTHIEQCAECQRNLDDARVTRHLLSSLPAELPADDFEARAFDHVRKHYAGKLVDSKAVKSKSKTSFAAGFASAIAAGVAVWFVNVLIISPDNIAQTDTVAGNAITTQVITVAMNKVQTVRLVVNSENDVKQVTLSLGLPDNIRLKGYESKKKLVWTTSLSKGENILSLPIKAIIAGQGNLIAQVQYGDKTKQFRILVKTLKETIQGDVYIHQPGTLKFVS